MIDLKNLQNNFDEVGEKLLKKGVSTESLNEIKTSFQKLKEKRTALEVLQADQNKQSKLFGVYKKENKDIKELQAKLAENKKNMATLQEEVREIEETLQQKALIIPNIPADTVPIGVDESENIEIKKVLDIPTFDFPVLEHSDLAEQNGWIDFKRGVKLAKSRFSLLRGDGARLERALINYMIDFNRERGYEEVCVPLIVNRPTMTGTGQLPKFENDLFKIEGEDLFLIPTAEVPLTNIYNDEIVAKDDLPVKLTAYTPCFRKEAGSAGRDTRGMIRQHQFDKVELVVLSHPDDSAKIFDEMVKCASDLLSSLGLAHRHMNLCTGDLGFSASSTTDLEVWFPAQNCYREISSISNTQEFQSRRAKIRYKDTDGKNKFLHTLNGSSLAVGRTMIAIMENFQKADGSIEIPEVLKKYM
ncbi:MAG: Seryl-tRNA synthetase (EC [uncultured Campylobacterales bacterium]|uniref:Serine--tRNA ligase n=1 Tax=uncultured Campylobacterales bacterium TaxID=352960 RepID=A0A6S6SVH7_9BACT|nr:MAG: Seryl-tRNA synthetase (EC [uncultured Campylobacterales bacterium]